MPVQSRTVNVRPEIDATSRGTIDVAPVVTKAEQVEFIKFQWRANEGSPGFVRPLMMDRKDLMNRTKNPWFDFGRADYFVARRGGEVVGRIAVMDDPHYNEFQRANVAWFGFFDSIDDGEVARALFAKAEATARAWGRTELLGPTNFSMNYEWGMLIDAFDRRPGVMMPYNPSYYPALVEGSGFEKRKDLWSWDVDVMVPPPEKVTRVARKIQAKEGYRIRPVNLRAWDKEIAIFCEIYNSAWEKNWGFVPMTPKEFDHLGKELKLILKSEMALVAEVDGTPVAFSITVPDANPAIAAANGYLTTFGIPIGLVRMLLGLRRLAGIRLVAMGIRKEFRKRGLDSLLVLESFLAAQRLGYTQGEVSWTLEDNDMVNRIIEVFGGKRGKTYRIYGRQVGAQ